MAKELNKERALTLEAIRVLDAIDRRGSFAAAARRLVPARHFRLISVARKEQRVFRDNNRKQNPGMRCAPSGLRYYEPARRREE